MSGTRFRLFPQHAQGYLEPEIVELPLRPEALGPGPSDHRMQTLMTCDPKGPYEPPFDGPPFRGARLAPALADRRGHFDHIAEDAQAFLACHLFGCVHHALDIWEGYLGHEVVWWHADRLPVLELVPLVQWNNAHSGPGFIETGFKRDRFGTPQLFCLNYDIVAHEVGHAILFSKVGVPATHDVTPAFLGFHEAFCDLMALIGSLHFASVVERLLEQTQGNLYVLNLVARIGEISDLEQIRVADNTATIDDVADLILTPEGRWIDPSGRGRNAHQLALPLTGAVFDVLVDIFQYRLAAEGVIADNDDPRGWTPDLVDEALERARAKVLNGPFAYRQRFQAAFERSLATARDLVGSCMAHVMRSVDAETLDYEEVAALMVAHAGTMGWSDVEAALTENFLARGIDPRPLLSTPHRPVRLRTALPYAVRARRIASTRRALGHRRRPVPGDDAYIAARSLLTHEERLVV